MFCLSIQNPISEFTTEIFIKKSNDALTMWLAEFADIPKISEIVIV